MNSDDSDGIELPPVAQILMHALRGVGYSVAASLADLIDNSIAAGSHNVQILFSGTPEPVVAVVDDGAGMDDSTLVSAMRFGSRDPRDLRNADDLGRFGLGMKTASLAQCRRLTVVSLKHEKIAVAAWDIDECERRGAWWLAKPDAASLRADIVEILKAQGHGTAVIWEKVDRLGDSTHSDVRLTLDHAMNDAAEHVALVFHRFLAGELVGKFSIFINGRSPPQRDPFLAGHLRGQALHTEIFRVEGAEVKVTPFVLPFPSRLKPEELEKTGGRESLKTAHGFYIYRGGRLVVPGGWFKIVPSDELIRLARVRVDVPVELDHLWKVDIRKTMAEPPPALRSELRRIVGAATHRSRSVYTHKGNALQGGERIPLWTRVELRDGLVAWRVNRIHPVLAAYADFGGPRDDEYEQIFRLLEENIPLHDIHLHISNDLPISESIGVTDEELERLALRLFDAFGTNPPVLAQILDRLHETDPFTQKPNLARRIAERNRR